MFFECDLKDLQSLRIPSVDCEVENFLLYKKKSSVRNTLNREIRRRLVTEMELPIQCQLPQEIWRVQKKRKSLLRLLINICKDWLRQGSFCCWTILNDYDDQHSLPKTCAYLQCARQQLKIYIIAYVKDNWYIEVWSALSMIRLKMMIEM